MAEQNNNIPEQSIPRFKEIDTMKKVVLNLKSNEQIDSLIRYLFEKVISNGNIALLERNLFVYQVMETIADVLEVNFKDVESYMDIIDSEPNFIKHFKNAKEVNEVETVLKDTTLHDPTYLKYHLLLSLSKIRSNSALYMKLYKLLTKDKNIEAHYKYELPLLLRLINIIKNKESKPEQAIQEIKNIYPREIEPVLGQLEDKKTLKEIKASLRNLSGEEIRYLRLYIADLQRWTQYFQRGEQISFFIERVKWYINGGSNFKGIKRDFKDERLASQMESNFTVKGLMKFIEKYNLIQTSYNNVRSAYNNPKWEGFLGRGGFIRNLESFARKIEKELGDKELAYYLRETKKKYQEDIKDWVLILNNIQKNLIDSKYQARFIERASNELSVIFSNRIKELTIDEGKEILVLEKHLESMMEYIKKESEKVKKEVHKVISDEKEKMLTQRTLKVMEFKSIFEKLKLDDNLRKFYDAFARIDSEYYTEQIRLLKDMRKDVELRNKSSNVISGVLDKFGERPETAFMLAPWWDIWTKSLIKNEKSYAEALLIFTENPSNCIKTIRNGLNAVLSLNILSDIIKDHTKEFEIVTEPVHSEENLRGVEYG